MSKWFCCLVVVTVLSSGNAYSKELPETSELDRQLLLLDRISYTPSLLPFIMDNIDYLELTPDQVKALRDWRAMNAPAMLEKMHEVAQGRIELVDLTLSPNSTSQQLIQQQRRLFRLQEEILSYKLSCRQNILDTFTTKQWDTLQFLLTERQRDSVH
jgi:hypothetical protein